MHSSREEAPCKDFRETALIRSLQDNLLLGLNRRHRSTPQHINAL